MGEMISQGDHGCLRGDVDNFAVALVEEIASNRLREEEDSLEIHRHGKVPLVFRCFFRRLSEGDPSVVDQNVNRSEMWRRSPR
jgi:hypothetical protein